MSTRIGIPLVIAWMWLSPPLPADIVKLKDGTEIKGSVAGFDGKSLRMKIQLGGGEAVVPYSVDLLKVVTFDRDPKEATMVEAAAPADEARIAAVWKRDQIYLGLVESAAGNAALALARIYVAKGTPGDIKNAMALCDVVIGKDWNEERKLAAKRLQVSALTKSGQFEEATKLAGSLQEDAPGEDAASTEAAVTTALVQGDVAWTKLQKLEADWPKWKQMPDKRREREILINQAINQFLYPVTFGTEFPDKCAEGLWRAAEVFKAMGRQDEARLRAQEIVDHFPAPAYLDRAKRMLREIEPSETPKNDKPS
jgi:hypothetical protein